MAIMDYCGRLYQLISQWNNKYGNEEVSGQAHASSCISSDVKQLIVSWLSQTRMVCTLLHKYINHLMEC